MGLEMLKFKRKNQKNKHYLKIILILKKNKFMKRMKK